MAVTVAVLVAAVLHASWNALLKGVDDRLAIVVLLDLTGLVVAALALPLVPVPAQASRGLLVASVTLHLGYELLLLVAYRAGDLSQVYPLARGTAPLLVAAYAGLVLGERLEPVQLAGLGGVCAGLVLLAEAGRGARWRPAVGPALATGVFIAAYTVADGLGVRRAGTVTGYVAWLFLLHGLPIPLFALAARGRALAPRLRRHLGAGVAAGLLAVAAYGLVLWAQRRGALAVVAALRETSVLVAALIGTLVFGERLGRRRVLAAALLAAGIVALNAVPAAASYRRPAATSVAPSGATRTTARPGAASSASSTALPTVSPLSRSARPGSSRSAGSRTRSAPCPRAYSTRASVPWSEASQPQASTPAWRAAATLRANGSRPSLTRS